jgi:hypothetical protein
MMPLLNESWGAAVLTHPPALLTPARHAAHPPQHQPPHGSRGYWHYHHDHAFIVAGAWWNGEEWTQQLQEGTVGGNLGGY